MVDRIRRAFEDLEAPVCPICHIDMKWSRSTLTVSDIITHLFQCPNCHRIDTTQSKVQVIVVPPDKLSAPRYEHAA
jgi:hypothetical protein